MNKEKEYSLSTSPTAKTEERGREGEREGGRDREQRFRASVKCLYHFYVSSDYVGLAPTESDMDAACLKLVCTQPVHVFIMHFENYVSAVVSEDADIFLDYQSDFEHIFRFS